MADVFISYKKEDRAWAERVAAELDSAGVSSWWDSSLVAGEHWSETIRAELRSARCVVVLWSTRSWQSRWVQAEASAGFESDVLIAARIDSINIEPPYNLVQTADLRQPEGMTSLLNGVFRRLGKPAAVEQTAVRSTQAQQMRGALYQSSQRVSYDDLTDFSQPTLRPTTEAWRKPKYLLRVMAVTSIGIGAFCLAAAFNNGDPRSNFLLTPLYSTPLLISLFMRERIGWWGFILLSVGIAGAHFAATFVTDEIYPSRSDLAARNGAIWGAAVGGALGASLSCLCAIVLTRTMMSVRSWNYLLGGTVILAAIAAFGFSVGPLPDDDKPGILWALFLYLPWQVAFTVFFAQIFRHHQPRRRLRA